MRVAGFIALATFSGAAVSAGMCTATSMDAMQNPLMRVSTQQLAGVTLNKTLDLLNGVDEIRGAAYDPQKGEVVFIGEGEIPLNERIDMDDLVVAVRSVFGMRQDPGITFYSTPQTMQHGLLDVSYFGATKGTEFGQILFDADYLLKQLTLGITPSGQQLTAAYPGIGALDYESFADRMIDSELFLGGYAVEFWFAPQNIAVEPYISPVDSSRSFVFSEMSMKVYTRVINVADGSEAGSNPQVDAIREHADDFADNLTSHYDDYADIAGFEILQKLKRLGRITSVVRWLRYNDIAVDLSFMENYIPQNVPTPEQINMLQVCRDHSQDGAWISGACSLVGRINGGIIYDLDYDEFDGYDQPTVQQHQMITQALASLGRSLNPQDSDDMKWTFTATIAGVPTNLIGIAQTVAESEKDGQYDFTSVDLAFPNQSGHALAFTRYYDSFSGIPSRFGPGWSDLPYTLRFLETPSAFSWCEDPQCNAVITLDMRRDLILVDRMRGFELQFQAAGLIAWTSGGNTVYGPYYLSAKTGDFIQQRPDGWFIYNRVNTNNQVIQQVWFWDRSTPAVPRYIADPYHVGVPGGGISQGVEEGVWLEYRYDDQDRLISVVGQDEIQLIHVEYGGDRISRVWYPSSAGTRDVVYTYDSGRLASATRSSGQAVQYTYASGDSADGTIATVMDQTRGETLGSAEFDLENRTIETVAEGNPALAVTVFYDRPNGLMQTTDSLGRVSSVQRDAKNRLQSRSLQANAGQGTQTLGESYAYADPNPLAGPTTVTDARGNSTTLTYDAAGNVTSIKDAQNRTTTIERGVDTADGLAVVVVTDPKGRKSAQKTDGNSRVIANYRRIQVGSKTPILDANNDPTGYFNFTFTYAPGYLVTYEYDEHSGSVEAVSRDAAGLAGEYPWISGNETAQVGARDGFGQATLVTSAAGYATQYSYDGLARVTAVKGPADPAPVRVDYHSSGLAQDRISSVSTANGTSNHTYDVVNRVQRSTDPRGITTSYFRNQKEQVERVTESAGGVTLTTQYFYDDFGRLQYKLLPNGTRVNYTYDGFDRMTAIAEREGGDAETGNAAPVLTAVPPASTTVTSGSTFSFDVDASDADNDARRYSLVDAPQGMSIDPSTGVITWTPDSSQAGPHRVVIQVADGNGGIDTVEVVVVVDDAVSPSTDNCTAVPNPDQRDTDGDGYGNACDADLNNDSIVNFADLAIFKSVFGTADPHADFNGDGIVDERDLEMLKSMFGQPPGPSGVAP